MNARFEQASINACNISNSQVLAQEPSLHMGSLAPIINNTTAMVTATSLNQEQNSNMTFRTSIGVNLL